MAIPSPLAVPELPVIRLRVDGHLNDGVLGSRCWPERDNSGITASICVDVPFRDPSAEIRVAVGATLTVEITAHESPLGVSALFFQSADAPPLTNISLGPNLTASLSADLPAGDYILHIVGDWATGDRVSIEFANVYYAFKIIVT